MGPYVQSMDTFVHILGLSECEIEGLRKKKLLASTLGTNMLTVYSGKIFLHVCEVEVVTDKLQVG